MARGCTAMHPKGSCKCRHCGEIFEADARNRARQRYCVKAPCRKARKAASQRSWLSKKDNRDYFRGAANVERVRAWREAHPGYWKRRRRAKSDALQDILIAQASAAPVEAKQDGGVALQDLLSAQPPVVVGLIAHLSRDDVTRRHRCDDPDAAFARAGRARHRRRPARLCKNT
jgi:hypothetical protein